uniref:Uncharacterized protein n=1 Tax=Klebsiella pneumoniae TaxID=573 RepID=A0A6B7Q4R1_KLEPN|nr:hypothetical protein [Klebsiella pneumoniae]QFX77491.1 hypothetical protein [Klebsiella pneumoniae]
MSPSLLSALLSRIRDPGCRQKWFILNRRLYETKRIRHRSAGAAADRVRCATRTTHRLWALL